MPTQDDVKNQLAEQKQRDATEPERKTIRGLLEDPVMQAEIAKALPNAITPDRFARLALTAINSQPLLQECDALSLLAACMQCAALGLEPNTPLQQCWLLPFWNSKDNRRDVNFILGYRGIIDLALRGDGVLSIEAREVCANDEFEYNYGLDEKLYHKPARGDRGEVVDYWCMARFPGGGHYWVVVSPETVAEHRARSSSPNSPAWKNDPIAMGKKTAVRIAAPYIPMAAQAARAIAADEKTAPSWESFKAAGRESVLDVIGREGQGQVGAGDGDDQIPDMPAEGDGALVGVDEEKAKN